MEQENQYVDSRHRHCNNRYCGRWCGIHLATKGDVKPNTENRKRNTAR